MFILLKVPCPEGTFYKKSESPEPECLLCPKGMYQDQSGQLSCNECPHGTTTREKAAIFADLCEGMKSILKNAIHSDEIWK